MKPEFENLCSQFRFPSLLSTSLVFSNQFQHRSAEGARKGRRVPFSPSQSGGGQLRSRGGGTTLRARELSNIGVGGACLPSAAGSCHVRVRGQLTGIQVPQGGKARVRGLLIGRGRPRKVTPLGGSFTVGATIGLCKSREVSYRATRRRWGSVGRYMRWR